MNGATITEKILARAAGRTRVQPGELVTVAVDLAMANDITAPLAIDAFRRTGAEKLFDPARVAIVLSHFAPARDVRAAVQCAVARRFAAEHALPLFFDEGRGGIEHALLPERGLVRPGMVILGADSHSCSYGALGAFATGVGSTDLGAVMALGETWLRVPETIRLRFHGELGPYQSAKDLVLAAVGALGNDGAAWKALEFCGPSVEALDVDGRLTLCNMAIEAGAKSGIVAADHTTASFLAERGVFGCDALASDDDARFASTLDFDVAELGLRIACPPSPADVHGLAHAAGTRVDQVFIGSCTNARIGDLRVAAGLLRGRTVARGTRCIVMPATQAVYAQALAEGLIRDFAEAGCLVGPPSCGPCLGGHTGVLAADEVCLSTSNRNFPGRMGHVSARVYLASPAVAAATAIAGRITHPADIAPWSSNHG